MESTTAKPLQVLFVLNRVPYPEHDGGAIAMMSAIRGYHSAGCRLHLLAMNTIKHYQPPDVVQQQLGRYGKVTLVEVDNSITVGGALKNLFTGQSYFISRFVSGKFRQALVQVLQQNSFDLIHIDSLGSTPYIQTARQNSRATVVYYAHNAEFEIWEGNAAQQTNPLKKWYLQLQARRLKEYELRVVMQPHLVAAISSTVSATFKQYQPALHTYYLPVTVPMPPLPVAAVPNHSFFFIGSLNWQPNMDGLQWLLKQVWPKVVMQHPSAGLTIAGKQMPAYISSITGNNVQAVGEVPSAANFMQQHGVMLVPLLAGSGVRVKIIEAMALGKTVIASAVAAEGLGATHGVNILIAPTESDFIACINLCMNNADVVMEIGRAARQFAEANYSSANTYYRWLQYLQNNQPFTQLAE